MKSKHVLINVEGLMQRTVSDKPFSTPPLAQGTTS